MCGLLGMSRLSQVGAVDQLTALFSIHRFVFLGVEKPELFLAISAFAHNHFAVTVSFPFHQSVSKDQIFDKLSASVWRHGPTIRFGSGWAD